MKWSVARKASPSPAAVDRVESNHGPSKEKTEKPFATAPPCARPRLTVFRSSKHIYAQLIDDITGLTLVSASSSAKEVRTSMPYGGNVKAAVVVGKKLAEEAKSKGIAKAAFDRGHYRYHGRIKALADAAREGGLQF
jgi:large subunit ribosomal protein L18